MDSKTEKTEDELIDRTVYYSAKFMREMYENNINSREFYSILSTILASSFEIFEIPKEKAHLILDEVVKQIKEKI